MKKLLFSFACILISGLIISGCMNFCDITKGSGKIVTEDRIVADFTKVVLSSSGNIHIRQGDSASLRIETDDNILPLIITEVNGDVLSVKPEKCISPKKLNIYLTMKELRGLKLKGSGSISGYGYFNTDYLIVKLYGSGNVFIDSITAQNISIKISGSGDVTMKGKAQNCNILIDGSGDVDLLDLESEEARIIIDGSGDCRVYANEKLFVKIDGSGDVYNKGEPKESRISVSGSGKIHKLK